MVSKKDCRELIEVLGIFAMFGLSVFVYLAWWVAFQHGGEVWFQINALGEMWFEYLLWMIVTPIITLAMYYYLKRDTRPQSDADPDGRA